MSFNAFDKTKKLQSGAYVRLSFDTSHGPRLEIFTEMKNISYMIFQNTLSGLSYAKRVYNGLQ